jgi:hypothetical protein
MNFWRRNHTFRLDWASIKKLRVGGIQLLLLLAISLLLNLGFESAREWQRIAEEEHQLQTHLFGWEGLAWYVWLAAAPAMLWLIRRYPLLRGEKRRQHLGWIMFWSLLLYLAVANVRYLLHMVPNLWLPDEKDLPTDWHNYFYNTYRHWPLDFLTFGGFFAVTFALDYYFKYQQRAEETVRLQLQAAQLQSDLSRAELAALRGQLHPHFLFNSFNALATLVRQQKNDAAVEIIAQLSALLRLAIDRSGLQEVPLHQEIDFIQRYLDIEHVRFGPKLRVDFALTPESLQARVPNIVLQPLVENAIKHGISLRTTPGTVRVATARTGDRLNIEIADDGPDGPPPACSVSGPRKPGIGLANTRAQLDKLYGADYRLEMIRQPAGGMVVRLDLPWHLLPADTIS